MLQVGQVTNKDRKRTQKQQYHYEWRKNRGGSSTPGKKKGIGASPIQRCYCARNRSWKYENYDGVMKSLGRRVGQKS